MITQDLDSEGMKYRMPSALSTSRFPPDASAATFGFERNTVLDALLDSRSEPAVLASFRVGTLSEVELQGALSFSAFTPQEHGGP